jgi:hypothetical protein
MAEWLKTYSERKQTKDVFFLFGNDINVPRRNEQSFYPIKALKARKYIDFCLEI